MEVSAISLISLLVLIFAVAAVYSSVGHGGASGYLTVLSFFSYSAAEMSGTALLLNVLVSSLALWSFARCGHRIPGFAWALIAVSIPLAFVGGMYKIDDNVYRFLLAFVLVLVALRIAFAMETRGEVVYTPPSYSVLGLSGGAIGLLSGIVGVGGGIFLSPLAIFLRWAPIKSVATLSSLFILVNSVSGLAGRALTGRLIFGPILFLLIAGFAGGIVGSYVGANRLTSPVLRRVLAFVLLIAAAKLIITALR